MGGVVFRNTDARDLRRSEFSHVYMYDFVFDEEATMREIATILNQSDQVQVIVTYKSFKTWKQQGLASRKYTHVASVDMETTAKQLTEAHILVNRKYLE